jgi:hypothetical protein
MKHILKIIILGIITIAVIYLVIGTTGGSGNSLDLDTTKYTHGRVQVNGTEIAYRAFENRIYVQNPVDVNYEKINIYVPEAYFQGKSINGYTAKTAPIFLPNSIGGYMPGQVGTLEKSHFGGGPGAALVALSKGYVVAEPGARGRTLTDSEGHYTGKAPAFIVDIKAAVRYLRHNKDVIPGDTEKIISNGTSAGGATSALLGASGNSKDYKPYLDALGAADERDDIFAVSAYCPITNLENADMAYEWLFYAVNDYVQFPKMGGPGGNPGGEMPPMIGQNGGNGIPPGGAFGGKGTISKMSAAQIKASAELKAMFPAYLNSLNLKGPDGKVLSLDATGNGTFSKYLESFVMASAQDALDTRNDLSKLNWLTIKDRKVIAMDIRKYAVFATRMKATPAFDGFDLSNAENGLFGTKDTDALHFTEYSAKHGKNAPIADKEIIKMVNPMNYIGNATAGTAKHWRIRHGCVDRDTSLAIPVILATLLKNNGYEVDFALPWGRGHSGDYDLNELFAWTDKICKGK